MNENSSNNSTCSHSYKTLEENTSEISTEIDLENGVNLQECKICFEKKPLRLLFCGHEMCKECVDNVKFINGYKTCPFCREIYLKKIKIPARINQSRNHRNNYVCVLTNNDCKLITKVIVCVCIIVFMGLFLKFRIV